MRRISGRNYQITCDVILYDDPNSNNSFANKSRGLRDGEIEDEGQEINPNALSSIFCCLVTSPTSSEENWSENERNKKKKRNRKNRQQSEGSQSETVTVDDGRDVITTIAFVQ